MIGENKIHSSTHSLFQKEIFKHLDSPLWKREKLVTFNLERETAAKLPFSVLVQFVQQWCNINGQTVQADNSYAPVVQFGNGYGYDHRFQSSVGRISTSSAIYYQRGSLIIQLKNHEIIPLLAERVNIKWCAVVEKKILSSLPLVGDIIILLHNLILR